MKSGAFEIYGHEENEEIERSCVETAFNLPDDYLLDKDKIADVSEIADPASLEEKVIDSMEREKLCRDFEVWLLNTHGIHAQKATLYFCLRHGLFDHEPKTFKECAFIAQKSTTVIQSGVERIEREIARSSFKTGERYPKYQAIMYYDYSDFLRDCIEKEPDPFTAGNLTEVYKKCVRIHKPADLQK